MRIFEFTGGGISVRITESGGPICFLRFVMDGDRGDIIERLVSHDDIRGIGEMLIAGAKAMEDRNAKVLRGEARW